MTWIEDPRNDITYTPGNHTRNQARRAVCNWFLMTYNRRPELDPPEELWLEACRLKRMMLGWAYYDRIWIDDEEEVTEYREEPRTPGNEEEVLQNPFQ